MRMIGDIRVEFLTPWIIASGASSSTADICIVRGDEGLPVVPGSALKGVFSYEAWRLADQGRISIEWVVHCFGAREISSFKKGTLRIEGGKPIGEFSAKISDHAAYLDDNVRSTTLIQHPTKCLHQEHSVLRTEYAMPMTVNASIWGESRIDQKVLSIVAPCIEHIGRNSSIGYGKVRIVFEAS